MAANEIHELVRAILEELKGVLRAQDYQSAWELNEAGESGIAVETVCTQLFEFDIRIPRSAHMKLQAVCAATGLPAETWGILEPLVD